MDQKLIAGARAVKRRRGAAYPTLWLITDHVRLPDPTTVIEALPRDITGVLFRHDDDPNRRALGRRIAAICRARRIPLVVADDARLAAMLGAGLHLRGGRRKLIRSRIGWISASAHDAVQLRRAAGVGADLVFLSPAFPTASHPGVPALGTLRWRLLAKASKIPVLALGGIRNGAMAELAPFCGDAGAIGALLRSN